MITTSLRSTPFRTPMIKRRWVSQGTSVEFNGRFCQLCGGCRKGNLISKAGEPVFVLWSEHISEWDNCEVTQETQVHVTYPRWKFVAESRIKAIMTTPMVELSEEQNNIKNMALRTRPNGPESSQDIGRTEEGARSRMERKYQTRQTHTGGLGARNLKTGE